VFFPGVAQESNFIRNSRSLFFNWLSKGMVSAQEIGMHTCLVDKNGSICQEYLSSECEDVCTESCFPGVRKEFAPCILGTCFDPNDGSCDYRAPKQFCEEDGGEWSKEIPAQCNKGCCLYRNDAQYTTERNCVSISRTGGFETEFREVDNELTCLFMIETQEKGACVFEQDFENTCSFGDKDSCNNLGGEFFPGLLCSKPGLNTVCEKQETTGCVEGKDEIYWFDSCGNRENIYDSDKDRSWNNGAILPKGQSCSLNDKGLQDCGNCNRFLSNICGEAGSGEKIPTFGDFICKDLSCGFVDGEERGHGESWCVYDSQIGLDGADGSNEERSIDVPGSRHYRKVCIDGGVRLEPCQDFRNGVCVQSSDEESGTSSAACVLNEWQLCIETNVEGDLNECDKNEACFLKSVNIDKDFAFDVCAPKYPEGFNLREGDGGDANTICSMASQDCTITYVKKGSGRWDCVSNCQCESAVFGEALNNLCISLGDCGGSFNIEGKFGDEGYNLYGDTIGFSDSYISGLKKYITPIEGQSAEVFNFDRTKALFGIASGEGASDVRDDTVSTLKAISSVSGGAGTVLYFAAGQGWLTGIGLGTAGYTATPVAAASGFGPQTVAPALSSWGGASVGALLGAAAVAFLIEATGIGRGLEPEVTYTLVAGGAVGGGFAGYALVTEGGTLLAGGGLVGLIILAVVVVIIVVLALAGVGDTKKKYAHFECLPWQPPRGGADCAKCGEDESGLPCSKYKCQSLGQTCEFLNEGTKEEECVDVSPNDVTSPDINPWREALADGYSYKEIGPNGMKIRKDDSDGCINAFTPVTFGIELDEPGSCKWSLTDEGSYEEMANNFYGGSNLIVKNHGHVAYMPSLDALGIPDDFKDSVGDYRLYTRCMDANGNSNDAAYIVEFCVSDVPDNTAAIASNFNPESDGFISFQAEEYEISFKVNEPAECKWNLNSDAEYEVMSEEVDCDTGIGQGTLLGWNCRATLPTSLIDNKFTYYFRCKDQPWLEGKEDEENTRNTNSQGVEYKLSRSASELVIDFVSPNDEVISSASEPVPLNLRIRTSGGADGSASCKFSINGAISSGFWPPSSTDHVQVLSSGLFAGDHEINYICEDIAGNIAEANSAFTIEIDNEGPVITRVYDKNGELNIITNEDAECAFDFESCNFVFEEGNLMSGSGLIHNSDFDGGLTHYVKCRDDFENIGICLTVTGGV